jgi:hypothetical protein
LTGRGLRISEEALQVCLLDWGNKREVVLFGGERIDLQVLASLIAWLGIERKELTAHVMEEQNRRGKQKDVQRREKKERPAAAWEGGREEMRSEGM